MSDDLISREEALQVLEDVFGEYRMSWGREYGGFGAAAQEVIEELPTAFDKEEVIEELENLRAQYFITIANTGDEKLGFAYKYIWNALDHAIKIVEKGGIE